MFALLAGFPGGTKEKSLRREDITRRMHLAQLFSTQCERASPLGAGPTANASLKASERNFTNSQMDLPVHHFIAWERRSAAQLLW